MEPAKDGRRMEGLRARLLIAFLLLSLIPLFGSNGVGYLRSRIILESLVGRYLEGLADLEAAHIQDRLEERILYLEALGAGDPLFLSLAREGSDAATGSTATAGLSRYYGQYLAGGARFDALALFTPDGRAIGASDPDHAIARWPDQANRRVALLRGARDAPPTIRLTVPVLEVSGDTVAYLAASIPLARGVEFLEIPEHVAGTIESFILDDRGRPIFVSHEHGHVDFDQPLASPLVRLPPGRTERYRDRQGIEVIGASSPLPGFDWLFLTEVPVTDALGELRALRTLSLVLGGIFALLVVTAAWFVAGGIVAPVERLATATRRLGGGDLDVRVPADGADEIGSLGRAFNQMADELTANQRRIEQLHRREIERAEQLATVGELASGLAHEIKNPVVGLSNGLDLVTRRVEDPELTPITEEMRRQLARIDGAVRDLLAFARPREPKLAPVSLSEVANRAVRLVQPGAVRRGVTIEEALDEALPPIDADAELLHQGVVNLLMNAVEHTPRGGRVRVSTGRRGAAELFLSVRDDGLGIEEERRPHIFRPFFTTRHAGTGLGLPITRGIVEQHGGHIEVESEPGEGSTFTVALPLDSDGGGGSA